MTARILTTAAVLATLAVPCAAQAQSGGAAAGATTGAVTGAVLPKPLLNVGVQIDQRPAEVLYAGAAPGLPAGVIQVNARVPDDVRRGSNLPLAFTVGGASSPPPITVSIRP